MLSSPEIFKDSHGSGEFEYGSQARHRTEVSITYFPVKWTGLSFEYEYGGVPPVFVISGHTSRPKSPFGVRGSGFWVLGSGFWVLGSGSGFRFWVRVLGAGSGFDYGSTGVGFSNQISIS